MMERIDAHLHLWQLDDPQAYPWLTPELGELYADHLPEEAAGELAENEIDGAILVQAADTLEDTAFMMRAAAEHPWVLGVVGWVDLEQPDVLEGQLETWRQAGPLCGVRHLVHDDPRANFLELPRVTQSLEVLAKNHIPLDVPDAFPRHLDQTIRMARHHPDLILVIDHLAKPPMGADAEAFDLWRETFSSLGALPQVFAKLSGLYVPGGAIEKRMLLPAFEVALESFGPARMMYGGDWPVSKPGGGYGPTRKLLGSLIDTLSADQQAEIWGRTARRVYPNIKLKVG